MFKNRISKVEINEMPDVEFSGEIFVVDTPEKVVAAVEYLSQQTVVGVDTETRPAFVRGVYYPVALLQVATLTRCYLFRLSLTGLTKDIADFLANPNIRKVGLAFKDDLLGLIRRRRFQPENCVDIQMIVNNYGILDLGLQKVFGIIFGQKISKTQRLTNWENEVLTDQQARYASTDAWATLLIYQQLMRTPQLPPKEVERIKAEDMAAQLQAKQEKQTAKEQN